MRLNAVTICVTLNPNGGYFTSDSSTSPKTVTIAYGSAVSVLPEVKRTDYTFIGWTYADGSSVSTLSDGDTVAAAWQAPISSDIMVYTISGSNVTVHFTPSMFNLGSVYATKDNSAWVPKSYNASDITGVYLAGQFCGWISPASPNWSTGDKATLAWNGTRYEMTGVLADYANASGVKFIVTFSEGYFAWMGANDLVTAIPSSCHTTDSDRNFLLKAY